MIPVPFSLDSTSKVKLYHQLYSNIITSIETGVYSYGSKLPSVRVLSSKLNISRNTVTKAYADLEKAGYVISFEKSGYFVAEKNAIELAKKRGTKAAVKITSDSESIPTVDAILKQRLSFDSADGMAPRLSLNLGESFSPQEIGTFSVAHSAKTDAPNHVTQNAPEFQSTDGQAFAGAVPALESMPIVAPAKNDTPMAQSPDYRPSATNSTEKKEEEPMTQTGDSTDPFAIFNEAVSYEVENAREFLVEDHYGDSVNPLESLARSYSRVLYQKPELLTTQQEPFGETQFRTAIANFLFRFHSIQAAPDSIITGSGIEGLLANIVLLNSIKNPSNQKANGLLQRAQQAALGNTQHVVPSIAIPAKTDKNIQTVFKNAEIAVTEVFCDDNGISEIALRNSDATMVLVSPKDLVSTTIDISPERRNDLLAWANEKPYRYIIEYDTEIAVHGAPTLKSEDTNEKVIYIGTLSDLIGKSVNASWLILPAELHTEYKTQFESIACSLSLLDQYALIDYLNTGELDEYLVRVSPHENFQ